MMISKLKIFLLLTFLIVSCASTEKSSTNDFSHFLEKLQAERNQHELTSDDKQRLAQDYVIEGSQRMQQNRYAEAVISYQNALIYDKNPEIYRAIANAYEKLFLYDFAIDNLLLSLKLDPYYKPSMMLLADVLMDMNRYEEAVFVLEQIPSKDTDGDVMMKIAAICERLDPDKATAIYEKMLQKKEDYYLLIKLAQAYENSPDRKKYMDIVKRIYKYSANAFTSGVITETLLEQKKYYELNQYLDKFDMNLSTDELVPIYKSMYDAYSQVNNLDTANIYLGELLKHIDQRFYYDPETMMMGGRIAAQIKEYPKAVHYFDRAAKVSENDPMPYILKGFAYMDMKNQDSALVVFRMGADSFPKLWSFPYFMGSVFLAKKKTDSALHYTQNSLKLDSLSFYALAQVASIYLEKKDYPEAKKYFEKAYAQIQDDALTDNNYAFLLAEMNDSLDFALKLVKIALQKDPDNPSYLDTYGWIEYKRGNYKVAKEYLLKALEKASDSSEVYEHLGDIYIKLEDIDKALQFWEKAFSFDPDNQELRMKIENNRKK